MHSRGAPSTSPPSSSSSLSSSSSSLLLLLSLSCRALQPLAGGLGSGSDHVIQRGDCGCYLGCDACRLGYCGDRVGADSTRDRCNPTTGNGYCSNCEAQGCNACGACGCDDSTCDGPTDPRLPWHLSPNHTLLGIDGTDCVYPKPEWNSAYSPQCAEPYVTVSDAWRATTRRRLGANITRLGKDEGLGPGGKPMGDVPLDSEILARDDKQCGLQHQATGLGAGRWYRFSGAGGNALPLRSPGSHRCGTSATGWLSGWPWPPSSAAAILTDDGNANAVGGNNVTTQTMPTTVASNAGIELATGPSVDYGEAGQYPVASDGVVDAVVCWHYYSTRSASVGAARLRGPAGSGVCFSSGESYTPSFSLISSVYVLLVISACYIHSWNGGNLLAANIAGVPCFKHTVIQVVRCNGFYLWQLPSAPQCWYHYTPLRLIKSAEVSIY